jgi:hypothetical protein
VSACLVRKEIICNRKKFGAIQFKYEDVLIEGEKVRM